jgi:4-hydroxy-tetrahydrodipicolinate synthase
MKTETLFQGAATALITPLTKDGVDYPKMKELLEWQIAEGISALVICGTSGEGSTLSDEEHRAVLKFAKDVVGDRVPLIAGTGSNDTAYAISLTKFACEIGYDAMLVVTPYYNKATQKGLVQMFTAIADASTKPIILYNVPSRTGCNLLPQSCAALADHPNIVGVKEASGNFSLIAETVSLCGDDLIFWSGNDDNTVAMMAIGAQGVISVASNIIPAVVSKLCSLCLAGDYPAAAELNRKYTALFSALFIETNPIPVKAAMKLLGTDSGILRLPLTEISEEHLLTLRKTMREAGLNV